MDGRQFIERALRDFIVVDALHNAIYAMVLTNGSTIMLDGGAGKLHFEIEIDKLREALRLLGVDTTEPLPMPRRARKR